MQVSRKTCVPKNVGRANATTAEEQAVQEAEALYVHQKTRKYRESIEESKYDLLLPMLAQKYEEGKHTSEEGYYCQPKLDGVRCLALWDGKDIRLLSRQGRDYELPHVKKALRGVLPKDWILDGELYKHGTPLQKINSLVKKPRKESEEILFSIYDAPKIDGSTTERFEDRYEQYSSLQEHADEPGLAFISSKKVTDDPEVIRQYEATAVQYGFEGCILRHPSGVYSFGYRSRELLKVKTFQDAEFEIVGYKDGVGKFAGKVIFVCKNDLNDSEFDVVPKGTMEERALMFQHGEKFIGKMYTVKFFGRTLNDLPTFPVGLRLREE